jgi:hypothetical protein
MAYRCAVALLNPSRAVNSASVNRGRPTVKKPRIWAARSTDLIVGVASSLLWRSDPSSTRSADFVASLLIGVLTFDGRACRYPAKIYHSTRFGSGAASPVKPKHLGRLPGAGCRPESHPPVPGLERHPREAMW